LDAARFVLDLNTRPIRRSIPAISTWLATAPERRKLPTEEDENQLRENKAEDRTGPKMPLLQILFEDTRRHKSHDQYSTILTHGHHKRFRELLVMFGSNQSTFTASNV